jgi:hypothetical protein
MLAPRIGVGPARCAPLCSRRIAAEPPSPRRRGAARRPGCVSGVGEDSGSVAAFPRQAAAACRLVPNGGTLPDSQSARPGGHAGAGIRSTGRG